jgi:hypothetical protein
MDTKKLMFIVLVLAGIACILASLWTVAYLYHLHAVQLAMPPASSGQTSNAFKFGVFVGLPSLLTLAAGVTLTRIGIKIGQRQE